MSSRATAPPPDPDLLRQLQAEAGTSTERAASPAEYVSHLQEQALQWLESVFGSLGVTDAAGEGLLVTLGVVVPSLLVAAIVITLMRHRRRRPRAAPASPRPLASPLPPTPADAFDKALADGDARAALAALWTQVGRGLDAQGIGHFAPDRTEREFLATVARSAPQWEQLPALRSLSRTVVVGLYGPVGPDLDEVRALVPLARKLVEPTRSEASS